MTSGFHFLQVTAVQRLCADAVAVTFDVPTELAGTFRFRAGQYLTVRRGEERRCYSICAPEGAPLRIGVRRVEAGSLSGWLVDRVVAGEQIEVGSPAGRFTGELRRSSRHVMIAAGSGITPILSLTATVLAANPTSTVTLLYGNRCTETVMFTEELADLKNAHGPRLHLVHVLSREPMETEILHGRLDAARLHTLLTALVPVNAVDHWWLCGPLGMITDAHRVLTELAVPADRTHRELFYVGVPTHMPIRPEERISDGVAATVIRQGRTTTLRLPQDIPVLDAAQRVRADLPFACKSGVCGSCRARLTAGEVRMRRNFALEPQEVAAGYVLTCQALPVSAELTLDYDA